MSTSASDLSPDTDACATPTISVVIPIYQAEGYLGRALAPLVAALEQGELLEVIVVDDGSTDGGPDLCCEAGIRVIPTETRRGPAAARNRGAALARGELLLFLDADTVMHADVPKRVRETFARRPECVALFGSYDDRPAHPGWVSQYRNLLHHWVHQTGAEEASTFWSGCGAIRREVFEAVGGFDVERFAHASVEDIELGMRLYASGHLVLLQKDIQVQHLKHWTFGNTLYTDVFRRARPWSRMLLESPQVARNLNLSRPERLRAWITLAFWASFALVLLRPSLWPIPLVLLVASIVASADFYRLVLRKAGIGPAVTAILMHRLYYLYSAGVYGISWLEHALKRRSEPLSPRETR